MLRWLLGSAELRRIDSLEANRNVAGLIAELTNQAGSGHQAIRGDAALALGRVGNSQALPYLAELARGDPDEVVRMEALWALGKIGGRSEVQSFIVGLEDPAPIVRMVAAEGLGHIHDASAIPKLRSVLDSDPDRYVRVRAAESLVELGDREVLPRIPAILQDVPWRVRGSSRYKTLKHRAALALATEQQRR